MRIYFSSGFPSAIKLNGIYFGTINDDVKSCEFNLDEKPFVEICPLGNFPSSNFIVTEEFLFSPPQGITVTDLNGGFLVYAENTPTKNEFCVIGQKKFQDLIITAFYENGLKISVETPSDFFADTLLVNADSVNFERFCLNGKNFVAVLLTGSVQTLAVYRITDGIDRVFTDEIYGFTLKDGLEITKKYNDIAKHTVTSSWQYEDEKLTATKVTVSVSENFDLNALPEAILPYAFLEEFFVGGDVSAYLDANVLNNKDKLKGFFGDFVGIMPPPLFRNQAEIGLVYKKTQNTFQVTYFTFTVTDRKIVNLKKT